MHGKFSSGRTSLTNWAARKPKSVISNGHFAPFLSSDLQAYVDRYWAVIFTVQSSEIDLRRMRHYLGWYCTTNKVVTLDHHPSGMTLLAQVRERCNTPRLPVLFVNKKIVGTIDDVLRLEDEKKLKDVLQFGFEWNTGGKTLLGPMPSAFADKELFRGQYVGAPITKPVMTLPKLHPHIPSPR